MNFEHTEDRRMLSDMLRRFISEQYGFDVRERHAQLPEGFNPAYWQRFAELGAVGALFGEADGGYGGTGFDISVVFEALGRGLVLEPFLSTLMAGSVVARLGTAAQKPWLEDAIAGTRRLTFAHTEPGSDYDATFVQTQAEQKDSGWTLNGSKALVAHGAHADTLLVSARTSGNADDEQGMTWFAVPASASGVAVKDYGLIDGGRAADITLTNVHVDDDARIGEIGAGYDAVEYAVGQGVLALCAEAIGIMDTLRDDTLEYLRTRKQFGVAIGNFQALQHRMADLATDIEQARSAVINAAAMIAESDAIAREKALSAAKCTIGRVGRQVAEECIQLHGGIGMTWELPLSHFAKRLVMIDHQLGDEDHHLERYIALSRA